MYTGNVFIPSDLIMPIGLYLKSLLLNLYTSPVSSFFHSQIILYTVCVQRFPLSLSVLRWS